MVPFWLLNDTKGIEGNTWASNPEETVRIGGFRLPGLCRVKAEPSLQIDRQKVSGRDSVTLIDRGYLPGNLEVEVRVWTPEQWKVLQEAISLLWRKVNKVTGTDRLKVLAGGADKKKSASNKDLEVIQQSAKEIDHPYTRALGITSVIVTAVSLPEPGASGQDRVVRFKCVEYVPAGKGPTRNGKVKGSQRGATDVPIAGQYQSQLDPKNSQSVLPPSATDAGISSELPYTPASGPY